MGETNDRPGKHGNRSAPKRSFIPCHPVRFQKIDNVWCRLLCLESPIGPPCDSRLGVGLVAVKVEFTRACREAKDMALRARPCLLWVSPSMSWIWRICCFSALIRRQKLGPSTQSNSEVGQTACFGRLRFSERMIMHICTFYNSGVNQPWLLTSPPEVEQIRDDESCTPLQGAGLATPLSASALAGLEQHILILRNTKSKVRPQVMLR